MHNGEGISLLNRGFLFLVITHKLEYTGIYVVPNFLKKRGSVYQNFYVRQDEFAYELKYPEL